MDCKTARTLLDFARPSASELDPRDAEELTGHLDICPECGAAAKAERQLDDCFGRAMRQVEVPIALRKNLIARLDAERGDWYRHRIGHAVRAAAIAAAVIFLVWGGIRWIRPGPVTVNLAEVCEKAVQDRISPTAEKVQDSLRVLGVETPVPADLRFRYLALLPALAEFQGKQRVPMLVFVCTNDQEVVSGRAWVYLLSRPQFELKNLPTEFASTGGYDYRIAVVRQDEDHAYLVLHTGADWNWLRTAPSAASNQE